MQELHNKNELFSTESLEASRILDCVEQIKLKTNKNETTCPKAGVRF